jgi:hypothetical protein
MTRSLAFEINAQPDLRSCGVTCLDAVYAYFGLEIPVAQLALEVEHLESGGTLAVMLACDALRRGFKATIYTYNLHVFDPTWFTDRKVNIQDKLMRQAQAKTDDDKLQVATRRYVEFLDLGGRLRYEELNAALLRKFLNRDLPILVGLSATYLYQTARERGDIDEYDDIRGTPSGHFVVLCGYDRDARTVRVADPLLPNPAAGNTQYYEVDMDRLIAAILLGIVTYDANILVIEPNA